MRSLPRDKLKVPPRASSRRRLRSLPTPPWTSAGISSAVLIGCARERSAIGGGIGMELVRDNGLCFKLSYLDV